jgi:hypothetical protein
VTYGAESRAEANLIDLVDIGTRTRSPLLAGPGYSTPRWDQSGEWLYYRHGPSILRRHLQSADTQVVYARPESGVISTPSGFDVGPGDGALAILTANSEPGCVLRIVEETGERERHKFSEECEAVAWSRDGRMILVSTISSPTESSVWRLDRTAGAPDKLPIAGPLVQSLSLGPDALLYTIGNTPFTTVMITGLTGGRR